MHRRVEDQPDVNPPPSNAPRLRARTYVETRIFPSASLTIHTPHGVLTAWDIRATVDTYYQGQVTQDILWNFADATLQQISMTDVEVLAHLTKRYGQTRPGGKTALVFARAVDYGIGRMFQLFAELSDTNVTFMPFHDLTSALLWLHRPAP